MATKNKPGRPSGSKAPRFTAEDDEVIKEILQRKIKGPRAILMIAKKLRRTPASARVRYTKVRKDLGMNRKFNAVQTVATTTETPSTMQFKASRAVLENGVFTIYFAD